MTRLLVLYHQAADTVAFDRYYFQTHIPIAKKNPRAEVLHGELSCVAGGPAPHVVAELDFDNADQLQNAMGSPEGQATQADLGNFAQAGVTILAFDLRSA